MTDDNASRWERGARRPWIPENIADRYDIERELGAGAAAVTVAAHDRRLGRRVAIKILRPEDEHDAGFSQRFTREAQAAASITHPNVVNVYDVGQEGELLYLVMQYVDGTDLKRVIERDGALPWRRAVEIASAVLAGLTPIHQVGIVHRDIKPQNVLIGTNGEVKVTDFGVAHVERDSSLTAVGTTVGTAAYMAPEQAQGETPSPAADVYAVGVMLYEMVTGRLPFNEPTSVATMLAHIQQEPPPPVAPPGREPIPVGIRAVIGQALTKDPRGRFRTADAMQRALEHPDLARGAAGTSGQRTTVVNSVPPPRRPRHDRRSQAESVPRRDLPPPPKAGRGFGVTFVMLLLLLAVALAAVAGTMWVLNEQPDLFGAGDDSDSLPTSEVVPTGATDFTPTPTPTTEPEPPVLIEPIDEEPVVEPTATVMPVPTSEPTTVPPLEVIIEEPPLTMVIATAPPDEDEEIPQIIEPIQDSTVPTDAQD